MYYIYQLRHRDLPYLYIGYTKDMKERYRNHKKRSRREDCRNKLNRAFWKFGFESFVMEEIGTARTKEKALEKEKMYIQKLKANLNSHHSYCDDIELIL